VGVRGKGNEVLRRKQGRSMHAISAYDRRKQCHCVDRQEKRVRLREEDTCQAIR
jgi:hypothetical protein